MARQIVVLALALIALVGLVAVDAATPTPKAASSPGSEAAAAAPDNDDAIGNTDEAAAGAPSTNGEAVEGPLGSEAAAAQSPSSGATTHGVSAVVAVAGTVAGFFVF
ncbi:hypothetical protein PTKIN_Ptkin02bG0072400 [Pterospermum kingtungense]